MTCRRSFGNNATAFDCGDKKALKALYAPSAVFDSAVRLQISHDTTKAPSFYTCGQAARNIAVYSFRVSFGNFWLSWIKNKHLDY